MNSASLTPVFQRDAEVCWRHLGYHRPPAVPANRAAELSFIQTSSPCLLAVLGSDHLSSGALLVEVDSGKGQQSWFR